LVKRFATGEGTLRQKLLVSMRAARDDAGMSRSESSELSTKGSASSSDLADCAPTASDPKESTQLGEQTEPAAPLPDTVNQSQAGPPPARPREIGGRDGPEPTRFGDWEKNGRCIDF